MNRPLIKKWSVIIRLLFQFGKCSILSYDYEREVKSKDNNSQFVNMYVSPG